MCNPDVFDNNGDSCRYTIRNSDKTPDTFGRSTRIFSYVREYYPNQTPRTSIAWSILPYDDDSVVLSTGGYLGSVVSTLR